MSNCLGVGAISVTSDKFVILMKRAKWTGEAPGKIDRPGGHPEPDLIQKSKLDENFKKDINFELYKDLSSNDVLGEFYDNFVHKRLLVKYQSQCTMGCLLIEPLGK